MKVYVDGELPKSCAECEWFTPNHSSKDGRNFCLLARMPFYNTEEERKINRGQHKGSLSDFDCPLKSLADHDKQVRKEVVQEIRNKLKENGLLYAWKGEPKYKTMEELLDQIEQGETK